MAEIIKLTNKFDPIFALDRGNDDKKLFEFLLQKGVKFIIRIKKNRKVILKETGEIINFYLQRWGLENTPNLTHRLAYSILKMKNSRFYSYQPFPNQPFSGIIVR